AAAARINALPGVLDHLPEGECATLDGPAEHNAAIRLPVWAASKWKDGGTAFKPTLSPNGRGVFHPYEWPEPTEDELARHVVRFGAAGVPKNLQGGKPKTAEQLAAASKDRDLSAAARKREARKTARRPSVKAEVAELLKRKPELLPSVVADV